MTAVTFRVTARRAGDIDREISALAELSFVRRDGATYLRCRSADADLAVTALARAGLRAESSTCEAWSGLRPALVSTLAPLRVAAAVDTVFVRRPPLGEAITLVRATTKDLLRRRRRELRERIRDLLRGDDVLLVWRRVVWAAPSVLRSAHRSDVHPVLFDTAAIERGAERIAYAGRAELAAWIGA